VNAIRYPVRSRRNLFNYCHALLLCTLIGTASSVQAAGIEETISGAIGLGRAANFVRVRNFMATYINPANLAIIPGNSLGFEARLPLFFACFDRAADRSLDYQSATAADPNTGESFDKVCNGDSPLGPTGNIGWAQSFESNWGYGVGFFTPAAISSQKWGKDTILSVSLDEDADLPYPGTFSGVEYPNRFLLLEREALAGFLMAGIGMQPIPEMRFGFSAGLGFAKIRNLSVSSVQGGTFEDQELLSEINAADYAIPRMTASMVLTPIKPLEIMIALTFQDDIRTEGTLDLTANGVQGEPREDCRGDTPSTHCRVEDITLRVPLPRLELNMGARYAQRRASAPIGRDLDPMRDELWDIELNGYWSKTSSVDKYELTFYDPNDGDTPTVAFTSDPNAAYGFPIPEGARINRYWKDTWGVRLGGDVNVIRSLLAVRGGISYESRAVPVQTMNIDAWPVAKMGLHAGATLAVDNYRFTLAYAHIFYQPVDVGVGQGDVNEISALGQDDALPVNEGHYEAALDILSLGAQVSF